MSLICQNNKKLSLPKTEENNRNFNWGKNQQRWDRGVINDMVLRGKGMLFSFYALTECLDNRCLRVLRSLEPLALAALAALLATTLSMSVLI